MDDGFVWSRSLPLSHPAIPAITALAYLAACAAHNTWRLPIRAAQAAERVAAAKSVQAAGTSWLDGAAVVHNALLVGFSALVCLCSSRYFALVIWEHGLHSFLCPPPEGHPCSGAPLRGPLFWWCYVFYASKCYAQLVVLRAASTSSDPNPRPSSGPTLGPRPNLDLDPNPTPGSSPQPWP